MQFSAQLLPLSFALPYLLIPVVWCWW